MCGIIGQAGKFDSDKYNFISQLNKLEHRGPDEKGFYFAKDIRLGCCRLAIVDKELNKQPMSYNQIHVVFNGEIYNFQSLKADLIAKGLSFTTNGDTEVILKLFQVYGETFVNKLNGMFAIAIWDDSNKNLLLFRDRMGQKPLFYKIEKDSIYFSSEMKSFLPLAKKDSLDLTQINSVLCLGYVNTGKTVINTVRSLIPGSYLKWRKGNFQVTKFWNINENLERTKIFNSQEFLNLFEESIKLTFNSERKSAVILSGGIDSTFISLILKKLNLSDLNTFTLSVEDSKFDESRFAEDVALRLKTKHHTIKFNKDPNELENFLNNYLDQPFADSSIFLTYQITKAMKVSDFVVGLGGEGGDELFGGYAKYVAFKKQQKMIKLLNIVPLNVFRKNIFENNNKKKYLEYRSSLYQYYLPWNTLIDHNLVKDLWTENISELIYFDQIDNFYKTLWQEVNEHDDVTNKIMKVDQLSYLPSNLNYKTDLASSANGVEIRSPYQDNRIVDYMNALPSNFKIQDKITKLILRNLLSEFFPDYDSNRTKFGFGFNRAEMIRNEYNELVNDYLSEKTIKQIGWFNHKTINKLIQLHENGKNLDNIIWPIFITTYWTKKWLKY